MKGKIGIITIIVAGLALIGVVSFVIIKSNQTVSVWVPNHNMTTGDVVKQEDISQVNVPADTPGNYINNRDKIIGYKLKSNVNEGQLLYSSSFLSSWETYNQDEDIPEDYIITSIQIPDSQAVGGLIVAGDTVDLLGIGSPSQGDSYGEVHQQDKDKEKLVGRENMQQQVHYILSNVKVINTNSKLSEAQDNDLSEVVDEQSSRSGSYYIVALSYDDAKKLRQAEKAFEGDLWLNIAPEQNEDNEPLLDQMVGQPFSGLHDAQKQVQDEDGNPVKLERGKDEGKELTKEASEMNEKDIRETFVNVDFDDGMSKEEMIKQLENIDFSKDKSEEINKEKVNKFLDSVNKENSKDENVDEDKEKDKNEDNGEENKDKDKDDKDGKDENKDDKKDKEDGNDSNDKDNNNS